MHFVTSSEHSGLVRTVGPYAKTWWSWRCIVNSESVRCLCLALERFSGLSIVTPYFAQHRYLGARMLV